MNARKLLRVPLTEVVLVSLLLLGWGIRDTADFFASVVRAIFLPVVVVALASAGCKC